MSLTEVIDHGTYQATLVTFSKVEAQIVRWQHLSEPAQVAAGGFRFGFLLGPGFDSRSRRRNPVFFRTRNDLGKFREVERVEIFLFFRPDSDDSRTRIGVGDLGEPEPLLEMEQGKAKI